MYYCINLSDNWGARTTNKSNFVNMLHVVHSDDPISLRTHTHTHTTSLTSSFLLLQVIVTCCRSPSEPRSRQKQLRIIIIVVGLLPRRHRERINPTLRTQRGRSLSACTHTIITLVMGCREGRADLLLIVSGCFDVSCLTLTSALQVSFSSPPFSNL